jgi:hypothetical protein
VLSLSKHVSPTHALRQAQGYGDFCASIGQALGSSHSFA